MIARLARLGALCGLCITSPAVALEPPGGALGLNRALELAQRHQPQLREAQANTRAARARSAQGLSSLLPQLLLTGSYQRTTANFVVRPGTVPIQLSAAQEEPSWKTYDFYNLSASVTQVLFDFGQTYSTWKVAAAQARAQAHTELSTVAEVSLQVRLAFFETRAAQEMVAVAKETLENQKKHLAQVEGFVEVGTRPPIDRAQAIADVANTEVRLIEARNAFADARAQLSVAMGFDAPGEYRIADEAPRPVEGEERPFGELLSEAVRARPELAALEEQQVAFSRALEAVQGRYGPSLLATTALNDSGSRPGDLSWNWYAGASINWPLFEGGLTMAQEREARANLAAVKAQLDRTRQQVGLELVRAQNAVGAAKEALSAAKVAVDNTRLRLTLAEGRYETGAGSLLELSDAQVAFAQAEAQLVRAQYALASARAQLARALGRP